MISTVLQRLDNAKVRAVGLDIILDRHTETELDGILAKTLAEVAYPVVLGFDPGETVRRQICGEEFLSPGHEASILPQFLESASLAHIVICKDPLDEVVRSAPLGSGADWGSFAEAMYVAAGNEPYIHSGLITIPFRPGKEKAWHFPTYSAANIDLIPNDWLEDRIVLIGKISPYSGDFFSTPLRFSEAPPPTEQAELMPRAELPGVVVHAYTLTAIQRTLFGKSHSWWSQLPYAILGALIGIVLVRRRWSLSATFTAIIAALLLYWWFIFAGFNWSGGAWLGPYCGLALALLLSSGSTFAWQEREERARRRWVQEGFSHFLSEERVKQIIDSPELLSLSAEEREVSILFTDLEGFTTLVDTLTPHKLTPILNGYLDDLIEIVIKYDGTVDKIIGDAVHAMFSAPLHVPEHRLKATLCALEMQESAETFRAKIAKQGVELGRTRIGISAGRVLVGNFGSSKRLDYTSHGSVVNLAARLESENKVFGTSICMSADVCVESDEVVYREVGIIPVRGLSDPVQVFEPLRSGDQQPEELQAYQRAFSLKSSDPRTAIDIFENLLSSRPDDKLVRFQLQNLREKINTIS